MHYQAPTYDQYFSDPRYQAVVHAALMQRYPDYRPRMIERNGRANSINLIDHAPPKEYAVAYEGESDERNSKFPAHSEYFTHPCHQVGQHLPMMLRHSNYRPRMLNASGRETNVCLATVAAAEIRDLGPLARTRLPELPVKCPEVRRERQAQYQRPAPTAAELRRADQRRYESMLLDKITLKPTRSFADTWGIK